jgi:hypothetical protein
MQLLLQMQKMSQGIGVKKIGYSIGNCVVCIGPMGFCEYDIYCLNTHRALHIGAYRGLTLIIKILQYKKNIQPAFLLDRLFI